MNAVKETGLDLNDVIPVLLPRCERAGRSVVACYPNTIKVRLFPGLEKLNSSGVAFAGYIILHTEGLQPRKAFHDLFFDVDTAFKQRQLAMSDAAKARSWEASLAKSLINLCLDLADIQFYAQYPEYISPKWVGKRIYAWKSVGGDCFGHAWVPYLDCMIPGEVSIKWENIDSKAYPFGYTHFVTDDYRNLIR